MVSPERQDWQRGLVGGMRGRKRVKKGGWGEMSRDTMEFA